MVPLIFTLIPDPGAPAFWVTWTPAALPCNSWSMVPDWFATLSLTFTDVNAPVTSFLSTVP